MQKRTKPVDNLLTSLIAAAPAETTEDKVAEEPKEEKKEEKKNKRASIFGNFFQKVTSPTHEKSEKEATAAPVEETTVASTAPQLENPVEEAAVKPIEPETVTAAADAEAAKPTEEAKETPAAEATTPKDKRRTSFFGNFGKKEKKTDTSDNEVTDGETKAKSKLGGLFRKPSKAVKLHKEEAPAAEPEVKAEEAVAAEAAAPAEETAAPVVEEVAPVETTSEEAKNVNLTTSAPVQAAA